MSLAGREREREIEIEIEIEIEREKEREIMRVSLYLLKKENGLKQCLVDIGIKQENFKAVQTRSLSLSLSLS